MLCCAVFDVVILQGSCLVVQSTLSRCLLATVHAVLYAACYAVCLACYAMLCLSCHVVLCLLCFAVLCRGKLHSAACVVNTVEIVFLFAAGTSICNTMSRLIGPGTKRQNVQLHSMDADLMSDLHSIYITTYCCNAQTTSYA